MLSAFGDDSADETKQRVFCVAGVVGRRSDWDELEAVWTTRLGGRVFHAKDCETDRGEFATTPHAENQQLYADLATLIAKSKIFGYSHAVDLVALKAVFGDDILWDSPFYFCFTRVLHDLARNGYLSLPQEPVEVTFDCRRESTYNTAQLYEYARRLRDWHFKDFLADKISFTSRATTGIQVADLLARESMKALDRHVGQSRALRGSLLAILKGKRFKFAMYSTEFIEQMKAGIETSEAPFRKADYQAWLNANGVIDNHSNRIAWLASIDVPETD